jgi:prophage DNA circulation protein
MAGRVGTLVDLAQGIGRVQNLVGGLASFVGWRARLRPASFRGVPFYVEEASGDAGRRVALHEYPERDTPWAEDLGRATRHWTVTGYVLGPFYPDLRDQLLTASETAGAGRLVHPYLGELDVVCDRPMHYTERDDEGGICRFELSLCEPGTATAPDAIRAAGAALANAAGGLYAAAVSAFATVYRVAGYQDFVATSALADLGQLAAILEGLRGPTLQVPTPVGVAARARVLALAAVSPEATPPATIAVAVLDAVATFSASVSPAVALDGLAALTTVAFPGPPPPPTPATPARAQEATNAAALMALTHQAAAAALPAPVSTVPLASYDDLARTRSRVVALCDRVEDGATDAVFEALASVRSESIAELSTRGATLRPLRPYATPTPRPSLTLAQRLYQDPSRADELVARTGAVHPAFMPDAGLVAGS